MFPDDCESRRGLKWTKKLEWEKGTKWQPSFRLSLQLLCSFTLHLSAPLPRLEVYAVITATDWTWSGTKAYGEVSKIPPLPRDSRAVIYFSKLPEEKCKYPSLQSERKSLVYRRLFHEFADHRFLSPHKFCSPPSVAVTWWWYLAPEAIFILM